MEIIARVAIAVLGTLAVVAGTYLDDDQIRAPTTAGDRNRHETS